MLLGRTVFQIDNPQTTLGPWIFFTTDSPELIPILNSGLCMLETPDKLVANKPENLDACEGNIRRQRINLETPTKQRCLDLQSTKWCDGVCLSSHPRLLRPNEVDLENSGVCPSAVESCPVHSRSKKSCLNKGCSWCDGKCRDPNAVLNEECASLIVCNPHADEESCPAGCEWVPLESKKCNDPTFSGCFVKEEACRGNIRRQRINVGNTESCFELDNTKWCDGVCLATNPRLLRPNEVTKIISSENK